MSAGPSLDLVALDEALTRLAETEAAAALGISPAAADRHWAFAKAWLYAELADGA